MRQSASGILGIWHDIAAGQERETLDWYDREHHLERLAVPGFLSARRYAAVEARSQLFIRYETASPEVLVSPAYRERVDHPTAWTLRCQPTIVRNSRTVFSIAARHGQAEGGGAMTVRFGPRDGAGGPDPEPGAAFAEVVRLAEQHGGVLSLEWWQADLARSGVPSREKELRQVPDSHASSVVVAHGTDAPALRDFARAAKGSLAELAEIEPDVGIYGLAFAAEAG